MHRFFIHSKNISGGKIIISDILQVHHIKDVMRFKIGDEIITFDEKGTVYHSAITGLRPRSITAQIKTRKPTPMTEKRITITVACAIPKKSKMDDVIDKLTQLGVNRIIPLLTERVIVRLDKGKETSRFKRWQKIALNASQQSQRMTLSIVDPIKDIKELLSCGAKGFDLKIIPTLTDPGSKSLREILAASQAKNILVVIGPEGDFTPEEINLAKKQGFIPVSLGDSVLRVDTAAAAVAAYIRLSL